MNLKNIEIQESKYSTKNQKKTQPLTGGQSKVESFDSDGFPVRANEVHKSTIFMAMFRSASFNFDFSGGNGNKYKISFE